MNRKNGEGYEEAFDVPRRRGDEPTSHDQAMTQAECSPQARG